MRTATSQTHIATVVFENWDAGRKVAISDYRGTLIKEILIRDPKAEWQPNTVISFSPSGKYLAIGTVGMSDICMEPIRILNCQTWEFEAVPHRFGVRDPIIYSINFSADEKNLIFKVRGMAWRDHAFKCFEIDTVRNTWELVEDEARAQHIIRSNPPVDDSRLSMAVSTAGSALSATRTALSSLASWGSTFFVRPENSALPAGMSDASRAQPAAEPPRTGPRIDMNLD